MSADNQSSSNALPFREGALGPAEIRRECPRFRILVIGKANAGKTTILRKVCNAKRDAKPMVYDADGKEVIVKRDLADLFRLRKVFGRVKERSTDVLNPSAERGEHNIEYQLTFPGSNFIFHDSRGIEAGSEDELKTVKEFIQRREQFLELKDQLHVIWYCVPMDDQRPISGAEQAFFSLGTGRVPVVLIFTKFDALELKCYSKLREEGKSHEEASIQVPELANRTFQDEYLPRVLGAKFPPKTYICLSGEIFILIDSFNFSQMLGLDKEENQCFELSEKTTNILSNDVLVNLFVSTQKNNLDLCIEKAIKQVWKHERGSYKDIVLDIITWFPNCWNSNNYMAQFYNYQYDEERYQFDEERFYMTKIYMIFLHQFPLVFSNVENQRYPGLSKFYTIAVTALLTEHSFWFSGKDMEAQLLYAIKSFKSQKHITISILMAQVETAFNNAIDKKDPAWLIQWVISHKLEHK